MRFFSSFWASSSFELLIAKLCSTFKIPLACYDCQLGNVEAAKDEQKIAFKLDKRLGERMLHETDLEPVWKSFD